MFANLKVADLRKLVSTNRKFHNMQGHSKMRKVKLIAEIDKRFVVRDGMLYLKQQEQIPTRRRITPTPVSSSSSSSSSSSLSSSFPTFPTSSSSSSYKTIMYFDENLMHFIVDLSFISDFFCILKCIKYILNFLDVF